MKKFLLTAILAIIVANVFAQERIAVFPFEDMENILTNNQKIMFYREFSIEFANRNAGRFYIVPRMEVERLIGTEMDFQLTVFSAQEKTAEMMRVQNATQILSGAIGTLNNEIRISVSLYTYPTLDQLPGGAILRVANTSELFNKIPELVQSMYNAIIGTTVEQIPEGLLYEIVDRKTVTITQYIGNAAIVNIPSHILDFPVITIEEGAFNGCESLTSITIPSSVTSIGDGEFSQCYSLTSITVDNRNPVFTSIDGVLFDKNIRTLIIYPQGRNNRTYVVPSSVTSIGAYAFFNCDNLTSVTIPSSVTSIGAYAYGWCRSLTNIMVDNRNPVYASVDGVLFDKNKRILIKYPQGKNQRIYVIPSSVTTIGDYAFWCCESLTSITIPSSVTTLGHYAFGNCSLTSVTIPNSVTIIGEGAFSGNQLTSVTIPNSVTSINWFAFQGNQLASVIIPNSVAEIGAGAFAGNQLTSVNIPNSVTEIEGNELPWGIGAFTGNRLTSVNIPNSVTSIGYSAFRDNQLTSVTIPNSVTSIGGQAFQGNRLVSITIGANVDMFVNYDNSFDYGFADFYYAQGRRAGTYTYRNYSWSRQ